MINATFVIRTILAGGYLDCGRCITVWCLHLLAEVTMAPDCPPYWIKLWEPGSRKVEGNILGSSSILTVDKRRRATIHSREGWLRRHTDRSKTWERPKCQSVHLWPNIETRHINFIGDCAGVGTREMRREGRVPLSWAGIGVDLANASMPYTYPGCQSPLSVAARERLGNLCSSPETMQTYQSSCSPHSSAGFIQLLLNVHLIFLGVGQPLTT